MMSSNHLKMSSYIIYFKLVLIDMYQLTFLQFVVKNLFQCFVRLIERETCLHFGKMPWFALKCEGCKIDVTRQGCSPDDIVGVGQNDCDLLLYYFREGNSL